MEVGRAVFFKTSFLFPSPSSEGEIGGKRSRKVFPLPPPSLICVASPEGGGGAAKTTQVARRRRQERRDQKKRVPTRRRKTDVGKSSS